MVWEANALQFPLSLAELIEAPGHDGAHAQEVPAWSKAADREVALVLHGLVAARGRHVLRHVD